MVYGPEKMSYPNNGDQNTCCCTTTRTNSSPSNSSHQEEGRGGIHLIYQYFKVKARPKQGFNDWLANHRQTEYDECLVRNLQHPQVERVHILLENNTSEDEMALKHAISSFRTKEEAEIHQKLTIHHLGRRMLYSDAFQYANKNLCGRICVIMNADIFLGEIIIANDNDMNDNNNTTTTSKSAGEIIYQSLLQQKEDKKTVWSLTRHEKSQCLYWKNKTNMAKQQKKISDQAEAAEEEECGCPFIRRGNKYFGSHDSFWFIPPISAQVIENCQHVQNKWGAEHKVINELLKAGGYRVLNPSKSIRTYHNHDSNVHPWRLEPGGQTVLADPRDHPPIPPTFL